MSDHSGDAEQIVEVEDFEITDEAIQGFIKEGENGPTYHTLLQIFREVLEPAARVANDEPTAGYCNKIITSYPEMTYAKMLDFRDTFYAKVAEMNQVLLDEIESDENCLKHLTAEEDADFNSPHYKNIILQWNLTILNWEKQWRCTDELAAVELAAISEVHKMFFGQTGLTSMLDNIGFEFTEADQQQLAEALQEMKDAE